MWREESELVAEWLELSREAQSIAIGQDCFPQTMVVVQTLYLLRRFGVSGGLGSAITLF